MSRWSRLSERHLDHLFLVDGPAGKAMQAMMGNIYQRGTGAISMKYDKATGQVNAESINPDEGGPLDGP